MRPKILFCILSLLCAAATALILISPLFLALSLSLQFFLLFLAMKVLHDSQTDTLTGVSNLRKLKNLLHYYHHIRRLTVIYLDVNELKQLNDDHGHETGNQALREVATFMLQVAGDAGQVYRVGGDEFILISEDTDNQNLARTWDSKIAQLRHVGISYGFASGAGKDLESLVRTAEAKMYAMKRNNGAPESL